MDKRTRHYHAVAAVNVIKKQENMVFLLFITG